MEGKGKEGTWTGTGKEATDGERSEEGTTWEVLQSVREGTTGWREWSLWGLGLSIAWFYKLIGF